MSCMNGVDFKQICHLLQLPLMRLSDYSVEFSLIYWELDDQTMKFAASVMKSIEHLVRKCLRKSTAKIYGF